jgi:hypothetical protein
MPACVESDWRLVEKTHLVPLANMLLATFLEEALVVRDSILAVDEAEMCC